MTELLAARIARRAEQRPESVAIRTDDDEIAFGAFLHAVRRSAAALAGMRRVAVLPTSDIGSLVAVTAAVHAGVTVVLLHRHLLPAHLARVLARTAPGAVIAAGHQHPRLRRLGYTGPLTTPEELDAKPAPSTPSTPSTPSASGTPGASGDPDDYIHAPVDTGAPQGPAIAAHAPGGHHPITPRTELLIGLTSGSTGDPKLFVRDQGSWAATLDRSDTVFDIGPGDIVATPGVLDHTHFLYGALHALTRGATVELRPAVAALESGATHLYTVPAVAWDVVRSGRGPFPRVRAVLSSAARWPRPARLALREVLPEAAFTHFYGASELSFVSADHGLGSTDETAAGTLFDGVEVEIRDGLVHVRSDMLFTGYLTEAGVTGGPVDGWCTVGDRGRLDGRTLHLHGRASETLIRGGLNVEPAEVEAALTAIPGILDAACVALPDPRMGEVPAAAVVAGPGAPAPAALRALLRAALPAPSMPVRILRLPALPRTPRGKVDRAALRALLAAD